MWWRWHSQSVIGGFITSGWHNRLSQPVRRVEHCIG
jgi:hypothetical protein